MKKQIIVLFLLPALIFFRTQKIQSQELQNFVIEGRFFYGDSARGPVTGVCADGDYLYITENLDSLRIFDISATAFPIHQTGACYADNADHLVKEGDLVFGAGVVDWDGFDVFDVSNVYAPSRLSGGGGNDVIAHPKALGDYLYTPFWADLPPGNYGLRSYDISDPANPILADYVSPSGFNGFDIAFYGAIAYMTDWGNRNETKIFDISDPYEIIEVGSIPFGAGSLRVYGRHLFCGPPVDYSSQPIRIYDIENPSAPVLELTLPVSLPNSWSMEITSGYASIFDLKTGTLLLMDMGGFAFPESLGAFIIPAIFPSCCFSQVAVKNDIVYYAAGDSGLYVLRYTGPMPINTGDVNGSGVFNGVDIIYFVNYLRGSGPPIPDPRERGDANGDCVVNGVDVVYMVNYLKGFGPDPIRAFCYGH